MDNPNSLHSEIMARLQEKQEGQTIDVVNKMPSLYEVQDFVMLGSFSWYWQLGKKRTLLRPFAMRWPEVVTTPSDLVRAYLDIKYPKLRALRGQIDEWKRYRSAPLYAQPHQCERGVYIDLRSAYWSIVQVLGWDVDYNPGQWLGRGRPMGDFPYPDFKLTRNCLVTAGLTGERQVWDGFKQAYKSAKMGNRHVNLGLWACTIDILQGIARDAVGAGAFYVHTDGYICDVGRLEAVQAAIGEWGLETTIKATGEVEVYGVGSYRVGAKSTKNAHIKSNHFDGLALSDHHKWLRSRFKFFAERTEFRWASEHDKSRLEYVNTSATMGAELVRSSLLESLQTPTQSAGDGSGSGSMTDASNIDKAVKQYLSISNHS